MENSNTYWRIFRIVPNRELTVIEQLEKRLKAATLYQFICRIVAPVEKVETIRNGRKVTIAKSIFQGFMYIEFFYGATDELFRIIETTKNVKGFYPGSLRPNEIENILKYSDDYCEKETVSDEKFLLGEKVKIIDGPFTNYAGKVVHFHEDKKRLKVSVTVFGRDTSVELKTSQVTRFI